MQVLSLLLLITPSFERTVLECYNVVPLCSGRFLWDCIPGRVAWFGQYLF